MTEAKHTIYALVAIAFGTWMERHCLHSRPLSVHWDIIGFMSKHLNPIVKTEAVMPITIVSVAT